MNLEKLIEKQQEFQPYLVDSDYTFIGPVKENLFEPFVKSASMLSRTKGFPRKIKHFLSDKETINKAILLLPPNTELRIYVIINKSNTILVHSTIEEYCEKLNINFP